MAYQRYGSGNKPDAYIWSSHDALYFWADPIKTLPNQIEFNVSDTKTAEKLFHALHDHLISSGKKIKYNEKTKELKIIKNR